MKHKKKVKLETDINEMVILLESIWKRKVTYTCVHCLREAYNSVINNTKGYVTDEDLIESSNNMLKHK